MDNCRSLLMHIFKQAAVDVISRPYADPNKIYRKNSRNEDSASAQKFIDKNNEYFRFYCDLLDCDPELMELELMRQISHGITMKFNKKAKNNELQELPIPA
jgi:hypothetical protein